MQIDIASIDREQFTLKEGTFCGVPAILVTPAIQGTQWTQVNKHLRSSIWSLDGELLSGGFPRFTNAGENPEHFPMPTSLDHATVVEKLDGSCAIFDYVNDQFSCRTRGTFSYVTLDNAADFAYCMSKHPLIEKGCPHGVSVLCELTTPNQRIVIDYGSEPQLTLIGAVNKHDYSLWPQYLLDEMSEDLGLERPRYFSFSSLDHLLADVKTWEGLEGCVIYSEVGLHKAKADAYLRAHRFKERVTFPNLLDIWFAQGRPNITTFKASLERDFDHECMLLGSTIAENICIAHTAVQSRIAQIKEHVDWKLIPIETVDQFATFMSKPLPRREAALAIQAAFQPPWTAVAFKLLDNREIDDKMLRKLIEHELGI